MAFRKLVLGSNPGRHPGRLFAGLQPRRKHRGGEYCNVYVVVKYPLLLTGIGERYAQTISNLCQASRSIYLRRCQYRRAFIAPLTTENNNILGLKCSLRHSKQITNLFIAPLPTSVCSKQKAADRAVCAIGNLFPNSQQLYEVALSFSRALTRWGTSEFF